MNAHDQRAKPEFDTLDESIAHSKKYDPWFRCSVAIVSGGVTLGAIAKLIYGREFQSSDPWIGPALGTLSFIWLMAFFHMFYSMVKIRLSGFTRWLCFFTYVVLAVVLGKILVVDSLTRQKQKEGESGPRE